MNCYQKFYTNQIHSSSLLCQLATMWKSQVLCDAIIRSGSVVTKAHRVVLVAACPMLQSMENAAVGSHLEVRLAADIKQESIQTFLQYLYEGFMMLTEQNCRDVEKIARLLQVDNVIKCCADFNKCLSSKTGHMSANDQYKYTFHDMVEFKHVRSSEMQKTVQERTTKRTSDFPQPPSPGNKRQRTQDMHADDAASMASSYSHVAPDPWDRVPKLGMPFHARGGQGSQQPGVIDIVEDSLELIQTDPPDSSGDRSNKDQRLSQKSVSIAVASKISNNTNLQIVDVATEQARPEPRSRNSMPLHSRVAPANQTLTSTENGKSTNSHPAPKASSHSTTPVMNDKLQVSSSPGMSPSSPHFSNRSSPQVRPEPSTHKPFAAGSESQSSQPPQQNTDLSSNTNAAESISDTGTSNARETQEANQQKPSKPPSPEKTSTDLTIVKIESDDEEAAAMEMYINVAGGGAEAIRVQRAEHGDLEEGDPQAEWMREDVSNEDSNVSGDQSNSWVYPPGGPAQYKEIFYHGNIEENIHSTTKSEQNTVRKSDEHFQSLVRQREACQSIDFQSDKEGFECHICKATFDFKMDLRHHMKNLHSFTERPYTCEICFKMFQSPYHLNRHLKMHSNLREFECELCGKRFKHNYHVKNHRCYRIMKMKD
ncbi:hypermethylated in cancer 2 protein-like isoform X3 [Saccostrea echinata]|uniref:hypermethylated in cancer 2 protein-like isoform X3 n=1 Tax=Saccostrea echinata TaxID=191078 RepID=UPI002A7F68A7|nr:hypermethylated in cancer 2 protein-like isoform X3 [Saccostrea echinata]